MVVAEKTLSEQVVAEKTLSEQVVAEKTLSEWFSDWSEPLVRGSYFDGKGHLCSAGVIAVLSGQITKQEILDVGNRYGYLAWTEFYLKLETTLKTLGLDINIVCTLNNSRGKEAVLEYLQAQGV